MHLALKGGEKSTIKEISNYYNVSKNHLMKVVNKLVTLGYIQSTQGRGGGILLAIAPEEIIVGDIVRAMEPTLEPIDCEKNACTIRTACLLKGVLNEASQAFLKSLDNYTVANLIRNKPQLISILSRTEPSS